MKHDYVHHKCNTLDAVKIGRTPVVEIRHPLVPVGKQLIAKLEYANPTFSIKDRTAKGLIERAMKKGALKPGGTIIESTSGNLGKSLAMLSSLMGFKMIAVVDPKVSRHNLNWYRAYGAEVDLVEDPGSHNSFQEARIARVQDLLKMHPHAYWPNQYENPDNMEYHQENTALEFADENFDVLVGCLSTGGHMTGIAKGLRKVMPERKIMACDVTGSAIFGSPFSSYLLNGVGLAWKTQNTDLDSFHYLLQIDDAHAIATCHIMAAECGLLIGGSSGLNIFGALCALHNTSATTAMAIVADSGLNYLDQFYDDAWLESKGVTRMTCDELVKVIQDTPIELQ